VTRAAKLRITGVVQGVGFRPFVYGLAKSLGLAGWVLNTSEGVFAVVEGDTAAIDTFARDVRALAPAQAVVQTVEVAEVTAEGLAGFEIRESRDDPGAMTLVSPDIATCPACLAEMRDPADRRHRYPFTNCTNCGPRFTIIEDVPYDRPKTTMRDFPMCRACAAEYDDPADRRFHAQPNACAVCGPRLYLNVAGRAPSGWEWEPAKERSPRHHHEAAAESARTDDVLQAVRFMLEGGDILAIKGLGGFHLACDATNEDSVARLRERKRRWGKPFAVMFPTLEAAREFCEIGDQEAALLQGSIRPIVLARTREHERGASGPPLAPSVAPDLSELGVMLPYTPLHHLLLSDLDRPLVMTSGNLTDEPIAMENGEALRRLAPLADAFLLHDRGIYARYDDSVVRVVDGRREIVRRSRGYAPFPIALPGESRLQVLAA
jgi:hydrogenase maturation protein HypF